MKWLLRVGVLAAVIALAVWLLSDTLETRVLVAEVTRGTAVDAVTGSAEVIATADVQVRTERLGLLVEVPVRVGQRVSEGEVIARQEAELPRILLAEANIRFDAARSRSQIPSPRVFDVEQAQEDFERTQQAVQLGQQPGADLERLRRNLQRVEAGLALEQIHQRENLELLEQQVTRLGLELDKMTLSAPIAGQIVQLFAFPGQQVGAQAPVARIVAPGRIVILTLSEDDFGGIAEGQRVNLRLAGVPQRVDGRVTSLGQVARPETKTREVFVRPDAPDALLAPGLSGEGLIIRAERPDALVIPRRALLGNTVYVVREGQVEVRTVQPGFLSLNQAEILSGLEAGELVVTEGQLTLRDGDRVTAEREGGRL